MPLTLHTARLILSPFTPADAPLVQRYAGDARIAATTSFIPHPYPDGAAEAWIATHLPQFLEKSNITLAIRTRNGELRGAINLKLTPAPATTTGSTPAGSAPTASTPGDSAPANFAPGGSAPANFTPAGSAPANIIGEIGYWVAVPFWGQGICTEAAIRIVRHGFEDPGLNIAEIRAHHFVENPASGRVMEKAGMKRIGIIPRALSKNGRLIDIVQYRVTRPEYDSQGALTSPSPLP